MPKPLVAIVGRPNVGKSTLFNRILGKRKALVQDIPGITRDRHYEDADWDGVPFRLVDTGGLELHPKTSVQKKMSEQAFKGIEEADLIVFVMDGRAGVTTLDREWVDVIRKVDKPKIFAINKIDSVKEEPLLSDFYELGFENFELISSETGRGVGTLLDKVVGMINREGKSESDETDDHFKIALIGRPNVGKSTLLNRLLGEERAIVDSVPGTTRDPVNSYLNYRNETYCIIDTAGIRRRGKSKEAIETFSIIKSLKTIERANLCLLLIDSCEGIAEQDAHVAGEAFKSGKAILILANKWDEGSLKITQEKFLEQINRQLHFLEGYPTLFISAKTGKGTDRIFPTIMKIRGEYERKVSTDRLREIFASIVDHHPLPVFRGRNLTIHGAHQIGVKPPTFIVYSNEPTKIHFSYKRYLTNGLKSAFDLKHVPVRILFRKKGKK